MSSVSRGPDLVMIIRTLPGDLHMEQAEPIDFTS